ncbi:AI-2E family transporter [Litoribacter ruber]|uniref:AI-2E family transporter n=1 Tax=Litoribacter ruber TaxID=702568 RepID=A0AAP2CM60_9BACT|nr:MULTISPECIES: AI-2E family transporter [Litoribacter]MBS9524442.1 AI-2E family transporter [Litoribacter alkaliphilus]MBT0810404.1 AI-2E family transporter [Litoribacter ruber]
MEKGKKVLFYSTLFIVGTYFLFQGIAYSKPFLAPLVTAMILAFLMLPITYAFEKWGMKKVWATISSTLVLVLVSGGIVALIFLQIKDFAEDWEEMKSTMFEKMEEFSTYLADNTMLEEEQIDEVTPEPEDEKDQEEGEDESDPSEEEETAEQAMSVVSTIMTSLTNVLLTLVYVFMFIHFRGRFKEFILRFIPSEKRSKVSKIISRSSKVSRHYLAGRLLLMAILTGMYFTGLLISGLENAFVISLIAAVLSIIPFIGNMIGYVIALSLGLLADGGSGTLIGITVTFLIAQFVDSYILQPIILGDKVDVHPFFIILSVILGNELWGVIGMVLAIPVFGMITVICRHVPVLNPFGYLFSQTDIEEPEDKNRLL